jgi:hypothetical protein
MMVLLAGGKPWVKFKQLFEKTIQGFYARGHICAIGRIAPSKM